MTDNARFTGTRVLVTGGGRGIGRAIAQAFAREGALVAINYRSNDAEAEACLKSLKGTGHVALKTDIGQPGGALALVEQAIGQLNGIDVLVNNAGIHEHHPIDKVTYETWQSEWRKTLDVNLIGAANVTFCAARHMLRERSGRIICVGSRGAFRGEPSQPAYGASKAGLHAFAQSMAIALAPYDIGVGVVAPGFVETEMVADLLESDEGERIRAQSPFGRVARPEEVANAVMYLADPASIWSSGAIIDVNGASYLRS
ncbi:MAG: SDR family oxidoreductase [Saprospiraceae bacterium]|nr:SDR family oxidoreductase [Saprospiraceae bacterium]